MITGASEKLREEEPELIGVGTKRANYGVGISRTRWQTGGLQDPRLAAGNAAFLRAVSRA